MSSCEREKERQIDIYRQRKRDIQIDRERERENQAERERKNENDKESRGVVVIYNINGREGGAVMMGKKGRGTG